MIYIGILGFLSDRVVMLIGRRALWWNPVLAADRVPAIETRRLDKTYVSQGRDGKLTETHALSDINLTIAQGEFICIIGASGCGKSTLLRIVAGFEQLSTGEMHVMGKSIAGPDRIAAWCSKTTRSSRG